MYQFRLKFNFLVLATAFLGAGQVLAGQLGVLDENVVVITPQPLPVINTPVVETPIVTTPVVETPIASMPVVETPIASTPVANTPIADNSSVSVPTAPSEAAPKFVPGEGNTARKIDAGIELSSAVSELASRGADISRGYSAMASMLAGQRLNQASLSQGLKGLSQQKQQQAQKYLKQLQKSQLLPKQDRLLLQALTSQIQQR